MTYCSMSHGVREQLGQQHRFAHCVRVARLAERLALRHGVSTALARRAGMLHDLARLYSAERLLAECAERAMHVTEFERAHPIVLHARLGAEIARERFGEHDEAVLQAIARHTVGGPGMTDLDAVVFLADALEPGRVYEDRERLAELAFEDLDRAMYEVIGSSFDYLTLRGESIAPETVLVLDQYRAKLTPSTTRRPTPERSAIPA